MHNNASNSNNFKSQTGIDHAIFIGVNGIGSKNVWRSKNKGVVTPVVTTLNSLINTKAATLKTKADKINWSGPNWHETLTESDSDFHGGSSKAYKGAVEE